MSLFLASMVFAALCPAKLDDYQNEIIRWRKDTETDLLNERGWLAVAGLCWLPEGVTEFTLDAGGHVSLPRTATGPAAIGTFTRTGHEVALHVNEPGRIKVDGKDVGDTPLNGSNAVTVGSVTMFVIERGQRIGIRVYDVNNPPRKAFTGEKWFPVDAAYRIRAKYTAYDKPKEMPITNVLGDTAPVSNPGFVEFTLQGKLCRLEAQDAGSGFFFNFKDKTSGKSTYPAGRFLDAPKPVDGLVIVDFNRATNPPCAFTDFATCPLPPRENSLPVDIKAGEMVYHIHPDHK